MYNISVLCTYNSIQNPIESNNVYQKEFLQAFELTHYVQKAVDRITNTIYKKMKDAPGLPDVLQVVKDSKMSVFCILFAETDESASNEFAFVCLFSYDLFHVFHPCICEYYSTGTIQAESIDILKKAIYKI